MLPSEFCRFPVKIMAAYEALKKQKQKTNRTSGHIANVKAYDTDASRWKVKSRQTTAEMATPGERGYGQKPDEMMTEMAEDRKHWHVNCHD